MVTHDSPGAAGGVGMLLRLEGTALLLAAVVVYARTGAPWPLFAILFLAPDLAFLFYLAGARVGAAAYNTTHSTIGPILLAIASQSEFAPPLLLPLACIWFAHVGFDRALGYGLKYASGFSDTHLGAIGRKRRQAS